MTIEVYPTWDDIKHELSKDDLFCILDDADKKETVGEVIDEFIKTNYEPRYERGKNNANTITNHNRTDSNNDRD